MLGMLRPQEGLCWVSGVLWHKVIGQHVAQGRDLCMDQDAGPQASANDVCL